jgi:RHS repeat-associated protein
METDCCTQTTINYTLSTQYALPESQTSGSPSDTNKQNTTSAVYDFNTGLVNNSRDANDRPSQFTYYTGSLRPEMQISPTLAFNYYLYDDAALKITHFVHEAGAPAGGSNFAAKSVKSLDGHGSVISEVTFGKDGAQDIVNIKYDQLGRVSQQSMPYRAGATPQWNTVTYDSLDRQKQSIAPDLISTVTRSYNQADPPGSSGQPGQTIRVSDQWGRERWARYDALGRMVEVAEPNPAGNGTLSSGAMFTTYTYDALDRLVQVNQGAQTRSFRHDSLGRLTHQKLAEREPTLNAGGAWVGAGQWSDVFFYDRRSNLTQSVDARGVKTLYVYNDDPLDRLQAVQYDKSGSPDHLRVNIPVAPNVSYVYVTGGDRTRVQNVNVDQGMGNETMSYDSEGRLSQVVQTFTGRESYPLVTNYLWDSLDRQKESDYPKQYGAGEIRKKVEPTYGAASRIESLKFGGATYASEPVYNAASQITSLKVGAQLKETYDYDPKTGLLTNQKVIRGATDTLVDLKYNYTLNNDPNNNGAKTGQLTGITDLMNQARNRAYEYDKLGRLGKVKGGADAFSNPAWHQSHTYDRYGNRTMIEQSGETAWVDDALPAGASVGYSGFDGGESWSWVSNNPFPYSGAVSHQSNVVAGAHRHFFYGATQTLQVNAGDKLYAYVYLDPANMPSQVMLEWNDGGGWEHRAYWGANNITCGTNGTESLRPMGALPAAGGWVRLEVPASAVGLEGKTLSGMSFTLHGGHAWWDKAGKRSGIAPPVPLDGLANLSYNAANNRITNTWVEYDPAGNQTKAIVAAGGTQQQYRYDCAGRLAETLDANGATLATYKYGASNQRLMSVEGGVTTYFAWDGGRIIGEYQASGANALVWKTSYVYLAERLLATTSGADGTETRFHLQDRLGTRLTTDAVGTVVTEQFTLPFGNMQPFTPVYGGENPYQNPILSNPSKKRFTSYDRSDATALDYAVNRFYSPQQGRFTQVDPIGMDASSLSDPQTLNLYSYCGNDPINHVDPKGLFWKFLGKLFKWIVAAFAVAVAIVTIIAAPMIFATTLKAVFGIISAIASAGSALMSAIGTKAAGIAGKVFGIIGAAADFVTSIIEVVEAWAGKGLKLAKALVKAGGRGASLASKSLDAAGEKRESLAVGLASDIAGYISGELMKDAKDPTTKKDIAKWGLPKVRATVKFARGVAEKIASLKGADKLALSLNVSGILTDFADFVVDFNDFRKPMPTATTSKVQWTSGKWTWYNRFKYLEARSKNVNSSVGKVNTCLDSCDCLKVCRGAQ